MAGGAWRLQARGLACARGRRQLFSDLSFELQSGEAMWLKGGNGSGKSSLLRLLCGLGRPLAGEIRWNDVEISTLGEEFRSQLFYAGHAAALKDDLTVGENLRMACTLAGLRCSDEQLTAALVAFGLGGLRDLAAGSLSQGQRRRVTLARLAVPPVPPLLLLDEPFVALDEAALRTLVAHLDAHLAAGGMVIYTTHQAQRLQGRRLEQFDLDQLLPC